MMIKDKENLEKVKKLLMQMLRDISEEERGGYQLGIVGLTAVNIHKLYTECD